MAINCRVKIGKIGLFILSRSPGPWHFETVYNIAILILKTFIYDVVFYGDYYYLVDGRRQHSDNVCEDGELMARIRKLRTK